MKSTITLGVRNLESGTGPCVVVLMDAPSPPRNGSNEIANAEDNGSATNCSRPMPEIENCTSEEVGPINRCKNKTLMKRRPSLDASEATSSYSSSTSSAQKSKGKGVACKRRNPRVAVARRNRGHVAAIGLPLGMSFAAVMAQVNNAVQPEASNFTLSGVVLLNAFFFFCLLLL